MRYFILLASTAMLTACGGAGPQSAGSTSAPPTGTTGGGGTNPDQGTHTFVNPTEQKNYRAVGGTHSYAYTVDDPGEAGAGQRAQLYQGDATTVRNTALTIDYNPRDAIFNVSFANNLAGTTATSRFQDPLHRTDFGGLVEPQKGTPNLQAAPFGLTGMNYLEAGASDNLRSASPTEFIFDLVDPSQPGTYDVTTYFYQTPGTDTQYVTFAGYIRNNAGVRQIEIPDPTDPTAPPIDIFNRQTNTLERGAFAYGELTANDAVPTTGTGSFTGSMLASMVFNDQPDTTGNFDTYFQWIAGTATTTVDFGANSFNLNLNGAVSSPFLDGTSGQHSVLAGAVFNANGSGQIDLVRAGGFLGQFQEAWFVNPGNIRLDINIAGSSIDGAFFGPGAQEVGGGYRIVGGTPDERIDILGTFVGKQ